MKSDIKEVRPATGEEIRLKKYNAQFIVSRVVIDGLKGLETSYPKMTRKRLIELQAIRKQLER